MKYLDIKLFIVKLQKDNLSCICCNETPVFLITCNRYQDENECIWSCELGDLSAGYVQSVAGGEPGTLVSGGEEGAVKIWDTRYQPLYHTSSFGIQKIHF